MTGVPKVNLQLDRNKEISKCLELLTGECDIPVAVLTVLGERRSYVRGDAGFPADAHDIFMSFLSRTSPELYMLYNLQWTEEQQQAGAPVYAKFYAGLPLVTKSGLFLGSLCVMDAQPRRLSAEQQELLTEVADKILLLLLISQPAMSFNTSSVSCN
jgi:hypothetical protein